jgi:hypothetical protein
MKDGHFGDWKKFEIFLADLKRFWRFEFDGSSKCWWRIKNRNKFRMKTESFRSFQCSLSFQRNSLSTSVVETSIILIYLEIILKLLLESHSKASPSRQLKCIIEAQIQHSQPNPSAFPKLFMSVADKSARHNTIIQHPGTVQICRAWHMKLLINILSSFFTFIATRFVVSRQKNITMNFICSYKNGMRLKRDFSSLLKWNAGGWEVESESESVSDVATVLTFLLKAAKLKISKRREMSPTCNMKSSKLNFLLGFFRVLYSNFTT